MISLRSLRVRESEWKETISHLALDQFRMQRKKFELRVRSLPPVKPARSSVVEEVEELYQTEARENTELAD